MTETIQGIDIESDIGDSKSLNVKKEVFIPKTIRMSGKTDFSIKIASRAEQCNMGELVQKAVDAFILDKHPDLTKIIDKFN